jgi:SAM-dependent methyltransferase
MIEKPCYICGGAEHATVARQTFRDPYLSLISEALNRQERRIAVCLTCGFVFHSPTLTPDEIATLYERYRDSSFRGESADAYFDRITSLPPEQSFNYQKVMKLNRVLNNLRPECSVRRIYDIGAGGGVFLKTFLDHSPGRWEAAGVEPTPSYAELAARRLGVPVISGMYRAGLFSGHFDFITIIKVLEHAPDPIAFLSDVRRDLHDEGLVYVEVPSVREVATLLEDHDQLTYTHLYFYSAQTVAYIADQAGFELDSLEEVAQQGGDHDLVLLMRKRRGPPRSWTFPLQNPIELISLRQPASPQRSMTS